MKKLGYLIGFIVGLPIVLAANCQKMAERFVLYLFFDCAKNIGEGFGDFFFKSESFNRIIEDPQNEAKAQSFILLTVIFYAAYIMAVHHAFVEYLVPFYHAHFGR